jgi:hypothetical protein
MVNGECCRVGRAIPHKSSKAPSTFAGPHNSIPQRLRALQSFQPGTTYDNVLWSVYGLKPGAHTVRLVPIGADARAKGSEIALEQAVVFRAP